MESSAVISACQSYRYVLKRRWGDGPRACFIMLNPSTADHANDDPTIRRCIGFATREGCGELVVVNLFAFRATNPRVLATVDNPIGSMNGHYVRSAVHACDGPLIAAWGAHTMADSCETAREVRAYSFGRLMCLGKTASGAPRHPLYVKSNAQLVLWP